MFYSSYGSFIHKILERYLTGECTADEMVPMFFQEYEEQMIGERPQQSTVEKYIKNAIDFLESFRGFGLTTIAVEKYVEFYIGKVKMCGYIDYIGRDEDGRLYIVDHKARELKQRSKRKKPTQKDVEIDEILRQLYLYSAAIFQESGEYPSYLCINAYRSGEFIKEPFCEEKLHEICASVEREVEAIMDESDFYPKVDYYKCRYLCGYHDTCEYYQMSLGNKHG